MKRESSLKNNLPDAKGGVKSPPLKNKRVLKKGTPKKEKVKRPASKKVKDFYPFFVSLDYRYKGKGKWVIIQLTEETSISDNYESIVAELKRGFGEDVEYFLPIYREQVRDKTASLVLFEGYVFVKLKDDTEIITFKRRSENIEGLLCTNNRFQYIGNKEINNFKASLQKMLKNRIPKKGQTVIPQVGTFKGMTGTVVKVDKKAMIVNVIFTKQSRVVEAPIGIVNLEVKDLS